MSGSDDEELVAAIRAAYASSAGEWAAGPAAIYRRLATALVATAPVSLAGRRVLDLGAGTGVATEALIAVGAEPVGLDLAVEMLAHRQASRPPGVAADAQLLPFRDGAFDAVVAAFSLNHVPDLEAALAECARVLRGGGMLLASTFPSGDDHPAKAVVEEVLEGYGYRRPDWYGTLKTRIAERTGYPEAFARTALDAGLTDVEVDRLEVEAGLDQPELAVEWRLNMPHTLAFVTGLDPATRAALRSHATAALRGRLPSAAAMLTLRATAD